MIIQIYLDKLGPHNLYVMKKKHICGKNWFILF